MMRGGLLCVASDGAPPPRDCFTVKDGNPYERGDAELEARLLSWIRSILVDEVVCVATVVWMDIESVSSCSERRWMTVESVAVRRVRPRRVAVKIEVKFQPPRVEQQSQEEMQDPSPKIAKPRTIPASAAAAQLAKRAPKKNKPKKPKNLCWDWQQSGTCPVLQRYGRCNYSHDEEWKGKGGRGE